MRPELVVEDTRWGGKGQKRQAAHPSLCGIQVDKQDSQVLSQFGKRFQVRAKSVLTSNRIWLNGGGNCGVVEPTTHSGRIMDMLGESLGLNSRLPVREMVQESAHRCGGKRYISCAQVSQTRHLRQLRHSMSDWAQAARERPGQPTNRDSTAVPIRSRLRPTQHHARVRGIPV